MKDDLSQALKLFKVRVLHSGKLIYGMQYRGEPASWNWELF